MSYFGLEFFSCYLIILHCDPLRTFETIWLVGPLWPEMLRGDSSRNYAKAGRLACFDRLFGKFDFGASCILQCLLHGMEIRAKNSRYLFALLYHDECWQARDRELLLDIFSFIYISLGKLDSIVNLRDSFEERHGTNAWFA